MKNIRRHDWIVYWGGKLTERFRDSWGDKLLGSRLEIGGNLVQSISYAGRSLGERAEIEYW